MSFKNRWTMSSSYDFQPHLQRSQRRCFSQTALLWFEVLPEMLLALRGLSSAHRDLSPALPGAPKVLSGGPGCSQTYHNHSHGTPVAVICDPIYSEGWQECPPRVWYSPEIDASKITLHILSDTPGVFQWLKYIPLMGGYLPKDGLPPAAYLGKTRFQEIRHFFHVPPYNSPTETPEGLPWWHSKMDILLEQLR